MIASAYFTIIASLALAVTITPRPAAAAAAGEGGLLGPLIIPFDVFYALVGAAIGGVVFTAITALATVVLRNTRNVAALLVANFAAGVVTMALLAAPAWAAGEPPGLVTILLAVTLGVSSVLAWLTVRLWARREAAIEVVDWESRD